MTSDQSRKFIQEYLSAFHNDRSDETLDKYISDQRLKDHIYIFQKGLPDYQLVANDIISEGNKVTVRFTVKGEHNGELFGEAPSGRKVSVDGIIIYEVENNKIINHWMQADSMSLMQQIGAIQPEGVKSTN